MAFWIEPMLTGGAGYVNRHVFTCAPNRSVGLHWLMTRANAALDVMPINTLYYKQLRPGYYPASTPDSVEGGLTKSSNAGYDYYGLTGAKKAIWNAAALNAGCDTLWVRMVAVDGGGTFTIEKSEDGGGVWTTIGTLSSESTGAGSDYNQDGTVTLSAPLTAVSKVRFSCASGTARLRFWVAYKATQCWTGLEHLVPVGASLATTFSANNSWEWAYALYAAGVEKYCGGWYHNSQGQPNNCEQGDLTETRNGVAYVPAGGYDAGMTTLGWTSTVAHPTDGDIATAVETYTLGSEFLQHDLTLTALGAQLNVGVAYPGMITRPTAAGTMTFPYRRVVSSSGRQEMATPQVARVAYTPIGTTGLALRMDLLSFTATTWASFLDIAVDGGNVYKGYFKLNAFSLAPAASHTKSTRYSLGPAEQQDEWWGQEQ